ncbi:hypothetical protein JCM9743_20180 [Natrinema sp. JCM 9743]
MDQISLIGLLPIVHMDEFPSNNGADRSVSRRTVLVGSTLTGLTALGGCLGGDENADAEAPDPITIEAGTSCDNCTMAIVDYPGPVGESFYDDAEELLGDDRPAQFCSSRCTYAFTFDHEDDSEPIATYVTDESRHAAGERLDRTVRGIRESDALELRHRFVALAADERRVELERFEDGEPGPKLGPLGEVADLAYGRRPVIRDRAPGGFLKPGERSEQRRLSGPVRADQRRHSRRSNRNGNVPQDGHVSVREVDVRCLE